jgi:hypothetical protein
MASFLSPEGKNSRFQLAKCEKAPGKAVDRIAMCGAPLRVVDCSLGSSGNQMAGGARDDQELTHPTGRSMDWVVTKGTMNPRALGGR